MFDNYGDMMKARKKLLISFPGSYINSRDEFIAHPRTNQYFLLADCVTAEDIQAKVLEWLSLGPSRRSPILRSGEMTASTMPCWFPSMLFWAQPLPNRIWRSFIASWETASTTS